MQLEREAKEFMSTRKKQVDGSAVRFYAGQALSAYMQMWAGQPQEEIMQNAYDMGVKMAEYEALRREQSGS